jgi:hypothetical protein
MQMSKYYKKGIAYNSFGEHARVCVRLDFEI